ncbi:hypothetical protein [Stenotrophomonas sp. TWI1409]|uniref:hypothetical protein n=1 Tax=unclassified Stenotrophomonas TaxID=196198 RepID=UPI00320ADDDC
MENATEKAAIDLVRRTLIGFIAYALPLVAIAAPILYFAGRVYWDAYWRALDVPAGLMKRASEDYTYDGFILLLKQVVDLFSWLPLGPISIWIGLILLAVLGLFVWRLLNSAGRWIRKQALLNQRSMRGKTSRRKKTLAANLASLWPLEWANRSALGLMLLLLVVLILIDIANSAGKEDARHHRNDLGRSGVVKSYERHTIAHLRDQPHDQSGIVLGCNETWCVLARRGEVILIPLDDIERLDHCTRMYRLPNQQWTCDQNAAVTP